MHELLLPTYTRFHRDMAWSSYRFSVRSSRNLNSIQESESPTHRQHYPCSTTSTDHSLTSSWCHTVWRPPMTEFSANRRRRVIRVRVRRQPARPSSVGCAMNVMSRSPRPMMICPQSPRPTSDYPGPGGAQRKWDRALTIFSGAPRSSSVGACIGVGQSARCFSNDNNEGSTSFDNNIRR